MSYINFLKANIKDIRNIQSKLYQNIMHVYIGETGMVSHVEQSDCDHPFHPVFVGLLLFNLKLYMIL